MIVLDKFLDAIRLNDDYEEEDADSDSFFDEEDDDIEEKPKKRFFRKLENEDEDEEEEPQAKSVHTAPVSYTHLLIAISIIGVLLIGSADSADQKKQAIGVVLGVVIMIIVSLLDYSWLLNFYWVLYIGNLMMLGVLYLGGSTAKNTFGATRWIQIGSFQFQPTELSKIFLIMFFAMFLMKHEEDLNTAKTIFTAIGLLIPPLVMIYRQPDLKNTITVMVLFCFCLLYTSRCV